MKNIIEQEFKNVWIEAGKEQKEELGVIIMSLYDELMIECKIKNVNKIKDKYNQILLKVNKELTPNVKLIFEYEVK